jgi:hypothetical protein
METTQEPQGQRSFNPNGHLIRLKDGEYLPVKWRIYWFRQEYPHGTIETKLIELNRERQFALFFAQVGDGQGGVATGYGSESAIDFADYIEKAETKAIGRALAALGFGTQFALELDEGNRIVDAPVERSGSAPYRSEVDEAKVAPGMLAEHSERDLTAQAPGEGGAGKAALSGRSEDGEPATEQQVRSIRKLCAALGRAEPEMKNLNAAQARALIMQLSREYNRARRAS